VTAPSSFVFDRQRIVVAGHNCASIALTIAILRRDGHCVTQVGDIHPASWDLTLRDCHLLISVGPIDDADWADLRAEVRAHRPTLALLCISDAASAPERGHVVAHPAVPTLREPFTPEELQAAVRPLLPQLLRGSVLARRGELPATC
jgi:DNA-binding NtrC family response regulator